MIWAWTGKTGSGKTFNMVKTAYKEWLNGRDIYSNIWLNFANYGGTPGCTIETQPYNFSWWERLKYKLFKKRGYCPRRGEIKYFETIDEILEVHDGIILFDEAQVLFNARQWESLPEEFQYKLQQHRKHQLELFCTTQNLGTIDITYRRLVQVWYHCELGKSFKFFQLHRKLTKDIDELYNNVDDMKVTNLDSKIFFIHRWTKYLYDTYFDIGFKKFKLTFATLYDDDLKAKKRFYIMPKRMQIKEAQREIDLFNKIFGIKTYAKPPVRRTAGN